MCFSLQTASTCLAHKKKMRIALHAASALSPDTGMLYLCMQYANYNRHRMSPRRHRVLILQILTDSSEVASKPSDTVCQYLILSLSLSLLVVAAAICLIICEQLPSSGLTKSRKSVTLEVRPRSAQLQSIFSKQTKTQRPGYACKSGFEHPAESLWPHRACVRQLRAMCASHTLPHTPPFSAKRNQAHCAAVTSTG